MSNKQQRRQTTHGEWLSEGRAKFGPGFEAWRFICPACGHIASVEEWRRAGATEGEIAFSCVGRRTNRPREAFKKGNGPCNYAGGGLFKLNPVTVLFPDGTSGDCFEFATAAIDDVKARGE